MAQGGLAAYAEKTVPAAYQRLTQPAKAAIAKHDAYLLGTPMRQCRARYDVDRKAHSGSQHWWDDLFMACSWRIPYASITTADRAIAGELFHIFLAKLFLFYLFFVAVAFSCRWHYLNQMAKVSINDLQAGSVLARDVKDANGRVLIPAGVEINDRHLRGLQMWGIRNVEIQSEDDAEAADVQSVLNALPPDVLLQVTTKADDLFRHADRTHPAIALLYEATLMRLATPQNQEAGPV